MTMPFEPDFYGLNDSVLYTKIREKTVWSGAEISFFIVILFGVFSSSNVAPSIIGDFAFVSSVAVFVVWGILSGTTEISVRRWALALILLIGILLFYQMVQTPFRATVENSQLLRVPVVTLLCITILFYIPSVVSLKFAMNSITFVSTMTILFGIPALILGPYTILTVQVAPYTDFVLPGTELTVPALTSFYADSNAISKLAMFGAFAGLYLEDKVSSLRNKTLVAVNILGLYLGHSRGAMLAFVAGIGVIIAYRMLEDEFRGLIMAIIVVGSLLGFGLLIGFIPAPAFIETIPLSSRGEAWRAAVAGLAARPILGYGLLEPGTIIAPYISPELQGLSPQNTFLYMYLISGFIGGTMYLLFIIGTLFAGARDPQIHSVLIGTAVAVFVLHFFEMLPLFGANQNSLLAGVFLGYLLAPDGSPGR